MRHKINPANIKAVMLELPEPPMLYRECILTGLDIYINYQRKKVNIFLPISFNICLAAQKNRLIETVLLSTHNIWVG